MSKLLTTSVLGSRVPPAPPLPEEMVIEMQTTGSASGDRTASVRFAGTNVTIDWGDGFSQTVTTGSGGTASTTYNRTYAAQGTYNVTMTGNMTAYGIVGTSPHPNAARVKRCLNWNLPSLTSLESSFPLCPNLVEVPSLLPPNVTNLAAAFTNCNPDLSGPENWGSSTSKVTNMFFLFGRTAAAPGFNRDIGGWDTSSVINMFNMFRNNTTFNQDIGNWDVSSVEDFGIMFAGASAFNQNLSAWDVSSATSMKEMFFGPSSFNNGGSPGINNWDTSNVTDMRFMFQLNFAFNQPIGGWDVTGVSRANMEAMLRQATAFNQDLSTWCVEHIATEPVNFRQFTSAWTLPKPNWGAPCP